MNSKNLFKIMIGISLVAHGIIIWKLPYFRQLNFIQEKKIEVSFLSGQEKPPSIYKEKGSLEKLKPKEEKLITSKINQEKVDFKANHALEQKIEPRIPQIAIVNLNNIEKEYRRNPTEINKYYHDVWEKVRDSAWKQFYATHIAGSVRLTFSIAKEGRLLYIEASEEEPKTLASVLKNAGLALVKNIGSFPPFPKEITETSKSFNITISFEPR